MELKKTPLYEVHKVLGAKIVEFAGWQMPVQYSGVIEEHRKVRSSCGIFDVSHMGEIEVWGPGAMEAVQLVTTNDAARIKDGQCQYTFICYPDGSVVDDCIVYRFNTERFIICVNASNADKAFAWITKQVGDVAAVDNVSGEYAQIALQGPMSAAILKPLIDIDVNDIKTFYFVMAEFGGSVDAIISRTGYTGEDGFEIYCAPEDAVGVWKALMEAGAGYGIAPIGLGARDTLRLEMGYPLYGHELDDKTTPIEAGLKKYVRLEKSDFVGKDALMKQAESGVEKTLVAFVMKDAGIPRADYEIRADGESVGRVTSGTHSPSLNKGIGMGYVNTDKKNGPFEIIIRGRGALAEAVKLPFYVKDRAIG